MRLVDLSAPIRQSPPETPEVLRTDIEFSGHAAGAAMIESLLGVPAFRGRLLYPSDSAAPGGEPVVVLSHAAWMRHFGGDPAVIGAVGMLAGFCGTLMTPMAANFNIVPAALLELKDRNGVIDIDQDGDAVLESDLDFTGGVTEANIKAWVQRGGNLVLTDRALHAMGEMGVVPAADIKDVKVYQPYSNIRAREHAMVSGLRGNKGRVAYGASKAAIESMTQVMAVELAGRVDPVAVVGEPLADQIACRRPDGTSEHQQ